jgi:hypothetical protein
MEKRRTHTVLPKALVAVKRAALKQALGAWKAADHPELKGGVNRYVRKLRRESDDRFKRVTGRAGRSSI